MTKTKNLSHILEKALTVADNFKSAFHFFIYHMTNNHTNLCIFFTEKRFVFLIFVIMTGSFSIIFSLFESKPEFLRKKLVYVYAI